MTSGAEEGARLAALHSYRVLDGPRPPALDELARLAAGLFGTPMASVSLIDRDRQWLAGNTGMPDGDTPRDISFCAQTVPARAPLVVPDARADDRFRTWANVTGAPHIRLYDGSPLIDEDGHALGALCVLDDRPGAPSDRRREALDTLARQAAGQLALLRGRLLLAELGDELARATQREEDLIATVSHELRTPVTNIRGYLELLTDDARLADLSRLVEPIHRNGERLVDMVDHLLNGTRPADNPLSVQRTPAELHLVATAAAQAARTTAEQRGVDLVVKAPVHPVVVHADVARLTQAVVQLIRNAVLFTPAGGRVTVRTTLDVVAAVEVADTGVGVPPDELPYVFQRFFRGRHARRQAVPGVGLGLHIAQQTATAHGGRITLTSSPSGTTARLTVS
ncbi:GAF domain-containing sensor histidine kinase [Dactylosporangium sp. AC04546]|uniref:GAF domain-containing sensor histidine kinase n=1 Tax=Dactylosporangium sp. AC04546 TaxID=2862460 RepID=UPI001EE0BA8D|nr:GAF domain-containing sensor histidine kinase [Dactylosporangium sp. AC04546]WVK79871.1 GAF domain-containing sensor histidine kinase [Dactylosporangium sp. AC04546]